MKVLMKLMDRYGNTQDGITEITTKGCGGRFVHVKVTDGTKINQEMFDNDDEIQSLDIELITPYVTGVIHMESTEPAVEETEEETVTKAVLQCEDCVHETIPSFTEPCASCTMRSNFTPKVTNEEKPEDVL